MSKILRYLSAFVGQLNITCPFCFTTAKYGRKGQEGPVVKCACGKGLPLPAQDYFSGHPCPNFGLIGAKNSGKTNFIASLLGTIRKQGNRFGWSIQAMDDQSIKRFTEEYYTPVFVNNERVDFSDKTVGKRPIHMLLTMVPPHGSRSWAFFNFFDTAGESLKSVNDAQKDSPYVANSDCLILLLDPLQIPGIRKKLGSKVRLPAFEESAHDILQRVAIMIRKQKNLDSTRRIDTPIAIVLTKLDLLRQLIPSTSALHHEHGHPGHFSEEEFIDVDAEVRSLMEHEWESGDIIALAESNFKQVGFFAVSALGSDPDLNGRIPDLKPTRVLDPLTWLLHQQGLIPKRKAK